MTASRWPWMRRMMTVIWWNICTNFCRAFKCPDLVSNHCTAFVFSDCVFEIVPLPMMMASCWWRLLMPFYSNEFFRFSHFKASPPCLCRWVILRIRFCLGPLLQLCCSLVRDVWIIKLYFAFDNENDCVCVTYVTFYSHVQSDWHHIHACYDSVQLVRIKSWFNFSFCNDNACLLCWTFIVSHHHVYLMTTQADFYVLIEWSATKRFWFFQRLSGPNSLCVHSMIHITSEIIIYPADIRHFYFIFNDYPCRVCAAITPPSRYSDVLFNRYLHDPHRHLDILMFNKYRDNDLGWILCIWNSNYLPNGYPIPP